MAEEKYVSYRWVMLALGWLVSISLSWGQILVSPYGRQLMADLGLSDTTRMAIFGAPLLVGIFVGLPGGILADKFGVKRMIIVAGIIAGLAGITRGFSTNFFQFFSLTVLFGFGMGFMQPNLAKLIRGWFPPREIGTAAGIQATAFAGGYAIGLMLTRPLFGDDWRVACYALGSFTLATIVAWFFLARDTGVATQKRPLLQDLSKVVRHADLWKATLMAGIAISGVYILMANLPVALESVRGIAPAAADAATSINPLGGLTGNLFSPIISDRVGLRKPFFIGASILGASSLWLTWNVSFGPLTWIFSYLTGICVGTIAVMTSVVVIEHKNIPSEILGTARGFMGTGNNTFTYLLPLMGGYITDWAGYGATFLAGAIMVLSVLVLAIIISETGPKVQATTEVRRVLGH